MPRYFFHRADGYVDHDDEGVELSDIQAARTQAIILVGATLQEEPDRVWSGQDFRVEVTNERGLILFTVITLCLDAASTARSTRAMS